MIGCEVEAAAAERRSRAEEWFGSGQILIEAVVSGSAFWLFLTQTFTAKAPFVNPALFRDRNFTAGTLFGFIIGLTYFRPVGPIAALSAGSDGLPDRDGGLCPGAAGVRHSRRDDGRGPARRAARHARAAGNRP